MKKPLSATIVLALIAGAFVFSGVPAAVAKKASPQGIRILGQLPQLPESTGAQAQSVAQVDAQRRRLYFTYLASGVQSHLVEYDLSSDIPKKLREVALKFDAGLSSPYTVALDRKRHRLLFLQAGQANPGLIVPFDLKKMKEEPTWDLETILPAYVPFGMTYSNSDDRIYMIGEFSQSGTAAGLPKPVGPGTSVVALDASNGSLLWVRPTPQCQHALTTYKVGALVAQSRETGALYFGCVTRGLGSGDAYPGQAGLTRLWITKDADQAAAKDFKLDFFPISGSYYSGSSGSGIALFDYSSDRFFLQSLSPSTPGAWVFDGIASAWVGFIGAVDPTNYWAGLDQTTGHYFIGGAGQSGVKHPEGYLIASDGRGSPVPQGTRFPIKVDGFITTDPVTRRMFIPTFQGVAEGANSYWRILVAKDETPDAMPVEPPRYDDLTADIPEGPGVFTDFSGGVNGYGFRATLIGGYRAPLSAAGPNSLVDQATQGRVRSGDRGITAARITRVDLRKVGASASAESLARDTNTEGEMTENGLQDWPWQPASCLDGAGEKVSDDKSSQGDAAMVDCDLAKESTQAHSSFGAVKAGPVSVGSSDFRASAHRDEKLGVVSEAINRVRNVEIAIPSGGSLSIGEVEAVATTTAHGRPGTTKATWTRTISGIVQRDEKDAVIQRFGECTSSSDQDTCGDLFGRINDALGVRVQLKLPQPDLIRTPKGAFAGVQQSDADFYQGRTVLDQGAAFAAEAESRAVPALQITIFNDSVERSRLLVQLAALQANSIYTISPEPPAPRAPSVSQPKSTGGEVAGSGGGSLGGGTSGPIDSIPLTSAGDVPPSSSPVTPVMATPVQQVAEGIRFLIRSPGEALLLGSVWLLFGGAGAAVFRRRMLLEVLGR